MEPAGYIFRSHEVFVPDRIFRSRAEAQAWARDPAFPERELLVKSQWVHLVEVSKPLPLDMWFTGPPFDRD